jgi:pilus assembly protein CpaB
LKRLAERKDRWTMKRGQLIGLGVAGTCAVGAFFLMNSMMNKQKPKTAVVEVRSGTVDVLVAKSDISLGAIAAESSFRWQAWPETAVPQGAITNRGGANPMRELSGSVARAPILASEPITKSKLIKPGEGGVLAAILTPGMRAISAKIAEDTAVGRLILPNDRVDVLLIKKERGRGGKDEVTRETLFRNVRILAIGQRIEVKEGQKNAEGNTATFELTPAHAERLAAAKQQGEITLTLRSIADINNSETDTTEGKRKEDSIRITRFGLRRGGG